MIEEKTNAVQEESRQESKQQLQQKPEQEFRKEHTPLKEQENDQLAAILVRGLVRIPKPVKDTLAMLRLTKKNRCVVVKNNSVTKGMLQKVKDYVTWGEISKEMFQELVAQRGREYKKRLTDRKKKYSYKTLAFGGKKYKPYFSLQPPRKGFGRKGIKVSFKAGGSLGYRREKINDLLKRML